MAVKNKKPTYNEFESTLGQAVQSEYQSIYYLYGPSDFLRESARKAIEAKFRKENINSVTIESETLNEITFADLWQQRSLFDETSCYTVKRAEKQKQLPLLLSKIPDKSAMSGHLIIVAANDKILVALQKELSRLNAFTIPCVEPWPNEMPNFISKLAKRHGLSFDSAAVDALVESAGTDLSKLSGEIEKVSLLKEGDSTISGNQIRPLLGLIRADHVFKLDQYLADGHWSKAHILCTDLISRGEAGLQILWLFANHCRKALKAHELRRQGVSARDIGFKLRLPPSVAKSYTGLVNRTDPNRFRKVLSLCQEADMRFKTSSYGDDIVLAELVESLAGRQ